MTHRPQVRSATALLVLAGIGLAWPAAARAEDTGSTSQCLFAASRYDVIWRPGTEEDTVTLDIPSSQLGAKHNEMWAQGWRVQQTHTRVLSCPNNPTTASYDIWWRRDHAPQYVAYWVTPGQAAAKSAELTGQGWRLTMVDAFVFDGNVYYNAAWRLSNEGQYDFFGLTLDQAASQFEAFAGWGWHVFLLDSYRLPDGSVNYNISFRPGAGTVAFFQLSPQDFEAKYAELWEAGWNVNTMSIFSGSWRTRYNVAWRQLWLWEEKSRGLSRAQLLAEIPSRRGSGWNIAALETYF